MEKIIKDLVYIRGENLDQGEEVEVEEEEEKDSV